MQKKLFLSLVCFSLLSFGSCFGMEKLSKMLDDIPSADGAEKHAAEKLTNALDYLVDQGCMSSSPRREAYDIVKLTKMVEHFTSVLKNEYTKRSLAQFMLILMEVKNITKERGNCLEKFLYSETSNHQLKLLKKVCHDCGIEGPLNFREGNLQEHSNHQLKLLKKICEKHGIKEPLNLRRRKLHYTVLYTTLVVLLYYIVLCNIFTN